MSGFLYGLGLQLRLDLRSRTMLIACYVVPLTFFAVMGTIFTSVLPDGTRTLLPGLAVFAVSMGALIGLPPSVSEIYGGSIKNVYQTSGVPLAAGLILTNLSAFVHLLIVTLLLYALAPPIFGAELPARPGLFFGGAALLIVASLCLGSVVGLLIRNPANTAGISIALFLPSIMFSGIMFPADMLPDAMIELGKCFPATWAYRLMTSDAWEVADALPLIIIAAAGAALCAALLRWVRTRR